VDDRNEVVRLDLWRRRHLTIRGLTPVPRARKGLRLHPDDDSDPYLFRLELSEFGLDSCPVVFSGGPEGGATALHLGLAPFSLQKRPGIWNQRPWVYGAVAVGAAAIAVRRRRGPDPG
jgi:hypothetical protein